MSPKIITCPICLESIYIPRPTNPSNNIYCTYCSRSKISSLNGNVMGFSINVRLNNQNELEVWQYKVSLFDFNLGMWFDLVVQEEGYRLITRYENFYIKQPLLTQQQPCSLLDILHFYISKYHKLKAFY